MNYLAKTNFAEVMPCAIESSGSAWPTGLIFQPGIYKYADCNWNMQQDGLYFFASAYPGGFDGGQRIVYGGDIPRLMSSLAWLSRYGRSDESLTNTQCTDTARLRSISMRCGRTIDWARYICTSLGITTRTVRMLTANTAPDIQYPMFVPYADGVDEGHVLLEAMLPTGWALFDVAGDVAFKDANGKFMSMSEVIDAGVDNCNLFRLAPSDSTPTPWSSADLPTEAFYNIRLRQYADKWRRGIYQIMGVDSGGYTYYTLPLGKESRESWVLGLSSAYRVVNRATFNSMFYS